MAFLKFPMLFSEDDYEKKETLGLETTLEEGIITINTKQICTYNEMENENVLVRMANGDACELPISEEDFEVLLLEIESIFDLSKVTEN